MRKADIALALLTCLLVTIPIAQAARTALVGQKTFNWRISKDIKWVCAAYGTWIAFEADIYADRLFHDGGAYGNNTYWGWVNITMNGELVEKLRISVRGGNVTVEELFSWRRLKMEVHGASGAPVVVGVYNSLYERIPYRVVIGHRAFPSPCPSKSEFDSLRADCWYYDGAERTVWVKVYTSSPETVILDYSPPPAFVPERPRPPVPEPVLPMELLVLAAIFSLAIALWAFRRR